MSTSDDTRSRGTHPVSVTHLVMGLVFLGAAGAWGLAQLDVLEIDGTRWIPPLVLVAAGAVGLAVTLGRGLAGRRRDRGPAPAPEAQRDAEDTAVLD